ncbi:MAG: TetR/AcrR family transcriptional regulator [Myxococcales bacterium]|nr:TetR/AcrR family transcriptional regulator [Myxococcales bacterium]
MGARAEASAQTGEDILAAARTLFMQKHYDEVTLQEVGDVAKVALKTVLRHFGSKDALLLAVAERFSPEERALRDPPVGDVRAIVRSLAARYEATMEQLCRFWPLEDRIPAVAAVMARARASHLEWLEGVFAPHLPKRAGGLRRRRLLELFAATEIYVWHSLRVRLGYERGVAEEALTETLEALVAHWSAKEGA